MPYKKKARLHFSHFLRYRVSVANGPGLPASTTTLMSSCQLNLPHAFRISFLVSSLTTPREDSMFHGARRASAQV